MVGGLLLLAVGLWATLVLAAPDSQAQSAPLSLGPAQGTSSTGSTVDTTSFTSQSLSYQPQGDYPGGQPLGRYQLLSADLDPLSSPLPGSNEVEDSPSASTPLTVVNGFEGLTDVPDSFGFSHIPPDPIMAAGPNHLMRLINTSFGIFSKTGTLQKKIDATLWYENVAPGLGSCDKPVSDPLGCAFDPKVVFDHFANRWVMVYLAVNKTTQQNSILVSVSDDSDPNGTWCNWAFRGDVNGSTPSGNWADYQGLGFDDQAVYIVPNQFGWDNTFKYAKIRILPKSTLYDPSCPAVTFTDLWDIRYPQVGADAFTVFTFRPAVTFGNPGAEYLMANSGFISPNNDFMVLFKLTNPLTTPVLTADVVPVVPSNPPPDTNQLGGETPLIDVGGHRIRNVVYRDGSVWTAHSVVGSSVATQANARYVRVDVASKTALEDVSIGAVNCWYYYPAIAADVDSNMAMVVNRSCTTEFASIRYVTRLDGGALEDSALLKAGEANYVKTFGSSRNRWGDYSGIAVDPGDPRSIWMFAEFAASPANTWSTWFGNIRFPGLSSPDLISPEDGAILNTSTPLLDWSDSTGDVVDYLLRVTSGDINNGPFDIDVVVNPVSQYQVTSGEALADASYVWQVTGRNAGALITASSLTHTFTVDAAPPGPGAPALISPADGAVLNTNTPFFDWSGLYRGHC